MKKGLADNQPDPHEASVGFKQKPHHWLWVTLLLASCSSDFDPFNEVIGFRLLAIKAEKPWLREGEATHIEALVSSNETVHYRWSWCPFTEGANTGFRCAVSEEAFLGAVGALGGDPAQVPPFELSTTETATYAYSIDSELLETFCQALGEGIVPDFVELPSCEDTFTAVVRLEAESAGKTIVATKELTLILRSSQMAPNQNPVIEGAVAIDPNHPTTEIPLDEGVPTPFFRDLEYLLRLDIPESASESFIDIRPDEETPRERREDLAVTWFIQAGETDVARTSFLDGEISLEETRENQWTTPKLLAFPNDKARLFFVIRDGRGGINWIVRDAEFRGTP